MPFGTSENANVGKWLMVDLINSKVLGKFVEVVDAEHSLTGGVEIVLDRPVQIESVNVPAQGRLGQVEVQIKTLHTPPIPWRPQFDPNTRINLPAARVANYLWIPADEVEEKLGLRKVIAVGG